MELEKKSHTDSDNEKVHLDTDGIIATRPGRAFGISEVARAEAGLAFQLYGLN